MLRTNAQQRARQGPQHAFDPNGGMIGRGLRALGGLRPRSKRRNAEARLRREARAAC